MTKANFSRWRKKQIFSLVQIEDSTIFYYWKKLGRLDSRVVFKLDFWTFEHQYPMPYDNFSFLAQA